MSLPREEHVEFIIRKIRQNNLLCFTGLYIPNANLLKGRTIIFIYQNRENLSLWKLFQTFFRMNVNVYQA